MIDYTVVREERERMEALERDAARYRVLRAGREEWLDLYCTPEELDAMIDAAADREDASHE